MYHFLYILFSWIFVFILLITLISLFLWSWSLTKTKVPFIRIPKRILKDIDQSLNLSDNSIVYDLGSGDGRVLFYLQKKYPKVKFVGIENGFFPFVLSKINNKFNKSNITFIKKDFFDVNLSEATHIFTYLYPNIMDDLLPKLNEELKRGTRLVSSSFHFTSKKEIQEIQLKSGRYQLSRKIYIYEF